MKITPFVLRMLRVIAAKGDNGHQNGAELGAALWGKETARPGYRRRYKQGIGMKAETHVNELVAAGLATVARGKVFLTDKGRESIKQYGDNSEWLQLIK